MTSNPLGTGGVLRRWALAHLRPAGASSHPTRRQVDDDRSLQIHPPSAIRHPPYAGFVLIMIGLLLHWPTLPTLAMLPVLVVLYWRLAVEEERETASPFGPAWAGYRRATPGVLSRPGPVSRPRAAGPEV